MLKSIYWLPVTGFELLGLCLIVEPDSGFVPDGAP